MDSVQFIKSLSLDYGHKSPVTRRYTPQSVCNRVIVVRHRRNREQSLSVLRVNSKVVAAACILRRGHLARIHRYRYRRCENLAGDQALESHCGTTHFHWKREGLLL